MRIAVTADLHWGINEAGDAATRLLVGELYANTPDVLIVAGDIGAGDEFEPALALFDGLDCRKALVPGNHDIWVTEDDRRGDSLSVYREHLPRLSAAHGFHYLDHGPLLLPDAGWVSLAERHQVRPGRPDLPALAVAGSMNWYDYTWADPAALAGAFPDWQDRLLTKRFTRGRHNDARFVRWQHDDATFTVAAMQTFAGHLSAAMDMASKVIVVTHHPPFRGLNFPRVGPLTPDAVLWEAFSGNQASEGLLASHAGRIPFAFCGHTHRARSGMLGEIRGFNVGSDYPFKRLLMLDWPSGEVTEQTFDLP